MMDETVRAVHVPDEAVSSTRLNSSDDEPSKQQTAPPYSPRVKSRARLRTTDLLPKRPLPYTALFLSVVFTLVVLNLLASYSTILGAAIGDIGVTSLSLTGNGTVANWFLGFLLTLSSLVCLQIYSLRKHRADDYRGTYRIWIWASMIFLLASLGSIVPLAEIFEHVLLTFTKPEYVRNILLVVVLQIGILSLIFVRGLFEIRASKGTLALLCFSWAGVVGTVCLKLPFLAERIEGHQELAHGNSLLLSAAGLFMTVVTFARYVYLESNGLVKMKVAKPSVANSIAFASDSDDTESTVAKKKTTTRSKTKKKAKPQPAEKPNATPPVPQVSSEKEAELKKLLEAHNGSAKSRSNQKKKTTTNKPPVPAPETKTKPLQVVQVDGDLDSQSVASDEQEDFAARKVSKSESRKARKLKKQQRRQQRRAA